MLKFKIVFDSRERKNNVKKKKTVNFRFYPLLLEIRANFYRTSIYTFVFVVVFN